MSEYEIPVGSGSLKLKGGLADAGKTKKCVFRPLLCGAYHAQYQGRKKKSKPGKNESEREREKDRVKELLKQQDKSSPSGSGRNSPAMGGSESSSRKTDAERRFEEVQKKRVRSMQLLLPTNYLANMISGSSRNGSLNWPSRHTRNGLASSTIILKP